MKKILNSTLKKQLEDLKTEYSIELEEFQLVLILFEMNRYFDSVFSTVLRKFSESLVRKFNQFEMRCLRHYFYYGDENILKSLKVQEFSRLEFEDTDATNVIQSFKERCEHYGKEKIIASLLERSKKFKCDEKKSIAKEWMNYYLNKRQKKFDFSLFVLNYSQNDFVKDDFSLQTIFNTIADIYDHLENYRHFVFSLIGRLSNSKGEDVTWKVLYKIGIFCENFIEHKAPFFPFKQNKCKTQLSEFLASRFSDINSEELADSFYSSISTGFKFEDCLISENQEKIILTFKKITLDKSPVPCPECMCTENSGNSYPEVFLRSYECENPNCPARSKSGRGKRFDEFSAYRYFKLVEDNEKDRITLDFSSRWRRDVFSENNNVNEMLVLYYAWAGEKICFYKDPVMVDNQSRRFSLYKPFNSSSYNTDYSKLKIVELFKALKTATLLKAYKGELRAIPSELECVNGNSAEELQKLKDNCIGTAVTSPPYFNAREYSQWDNLISYLIDMYINCKAVFSKMEEKGYYLYNIGDVVGEDRIYVKSLMSKRRLQLGFLSSLIFENAGFNLVGNIIWDKGEVQSKRNSNRNRYSGYIKCINCYEHILVFKKGEEINYVSKVEKFNPVIKINNKKENTYGHTAPYPETLVALVEPFLKKDLYLLDPFLGSGTTLKWCRKKGYKGIGYELVENYYELAKKNIFKD